MGTLKKKRKKIEKCSKLRSQVFCGLQSRLQSIIIIFVIFFQLDFFLLMSFYRVIAFQTKTQKQYILTFYILFFFSCYISS